MNGASRSPAAQRRGAHAPALPSALPKHTTPATPRPRTHAHNKHRAHARVRHSASHRHRDQSSALRPFSSLASRQPSLILRAALAGRLLSQRLTQRVAPSARAPSAPPRRPSCPNRSVASQTQGGSVPGGARCEDARRGAEPEQRREGRARRTRERRGDDVAVVASPRVAPEKHPSVWRREEIPPAADPPDPIGRAARPTRARSRSRDASSSRRAHVRAAERRLDRSIGLDRSACRSPLKACPCRVGSPS